MRKNSEKARFFANSSFAISRRDSHRCAIPSNKSKSSNNNLTTYPPIYPSARPEVRVLTDLPVIFPNTGKIQDPGV
jgi:hypothetical protein